MKNEDNIYDVIILGAGAAGLMSAITAGKRGKKVLILEKSNKVGKKILMSGGGKSNFTNLNVEPKNFISANSHFSISALNRYKPEDFIDLVKKHNIPFEQKKHNQLFCVNSSKDIVNMLLKECKDVNVEIITHCDTQLIKKIMQEEKKEILNQNSKYRFELKGLFSNTNSNFCFLAGSLIIATGALSIPTLGGSGYGYDVATEYSLELLNRRAGLVPFMFNGPIKEISDRLSGTSLDVEVSCNGYSFLESLLFTHRGISGPSILQISSYWLPGDSIILNLMPYNDAQLLLLNAKKEKEGILLRTFLSKLLPKALVLELQNLWWSDFSDKPFAELSNKLLKDIGGRLNEWELKPSETEGYRTAEVTLGGVNTDGISSKTMEAIEHPGLYFVGEVLDVSGHLGGFNFQWAWASGYTAGLFA